MAHLTSITDGKRWICGSPLLDGSARRCRRLATKFLVIESKSVFANNGVEEAPVCDMHARRDLATAREAETPEARERAAQERERIAQRSREFTRQWIAERNARR